MTPSPPPLHVCRTARDRQLLLEAAYAEAAVAGRLRQPVSYVAADKRLQDQHDYLDEVRGGEG